jgi:hypothetical protein
MWRMREKSLSVHRNYGDFIMVLYLQSPLRIRLKYFGLKNINAFGEYAKSIFPYMENTPIDITESLSRRIFDQIPKKLGFKSLYWVRMGKKTSHATVFFNAPLILIVREVIFHAGKTQNRRLQGFIEGAFLTPKLS